MKKTDLIELSRRNLITRIFPACTAACILPGKIPGLFELEKNEIFQQAQHKFDVETTLTFRQLFQRMYFNTIVFGKLLKEEFGNEKAIELIKKLIYKGMIENGKRYAQTTENNSLQTFVKMFKDPNRFKNHLTKKIVEDTEKTFELKVTECIWADIFLKQNAGDIGFAWVCYGDYALPQGFNPKIKMVRDKTLMEGDTYCNHRYIWTG